MYSLVSRLAELPEFPVPIPGLRGVVTAQALNADPAMGPAVFLFNMHAGMWIPAHRHARATETFYVVEGEFIDDGKVYRGGTYFVVLPGERHGHHETKSGCKVLVIQSGAVDPTDFEIVT